MKRIKSIDIARSIGIFLIVLGHTFRSGYLAYYIYTFHVPLFFVLSGLCWKTPDSCSAFFKKKTLTILVPYINFALISIVVYSVMNQFVSGQLLGNQVNTSIGYSILGMVYGNSEFGNMTWNRPLWFLPCLFACNFIVYFFEELRLRLHYKRVFNVVFLFLIHGIVVSLFPNLNLPFQIETAIGMAGFFECGIILQKYYAFLDSTVNKVKLPALVCCLCGLQALGISCILLNNNVRIDVRVDHYGNYLLYILGAISLIIAVLIVSVKIHSAVLEYVGKHTLPILLMHKFPIIFVQAIVPGGSIVLISPNSCLALFVSIITSVATIALCLIADVIIKKFLPILYGKL